ncbi:hypothetical protein [Thermofilum sp.]|uniref:hypothetical protein n=1 Tax=Thermofilum sp. TaxID=1961369 RepID=UPI00317E760B
MTSNYAIGRAKEYRVKRKLEKEGYFVLRSSGSHSPVDLIAIKNGQVRLIQCKKRKYLSPKEKMDKEKVEKITGYIIEIL